MPDPSVSAIYTTVHGNTGSSTHWARPGIEHATSWFLVGFVSAAPWRELPCSWIFKALCHSRNPQELLFLWSPPYRWGNWGTEKLNEFSKVTQLTGGWARQWDSRAVSWSTLLYSLWPFPQWPWPLRTALWHLQWRDQQQMATANLNSVSYAYMFTYMCSVIKSWCLLKKRKTPQ